MRELKPGQAINPIISLIVKQVLSEAGCILEGLDDTGRVQLSFAPDRQALPADCVSALCFVPYALWVSFAAYLNAGLFILN